MRGLTIRWLATTFSVLLADYLLDGIYVSGFLSALFAAGALGFFNAFFRPILLILTLPINLLSLGFFTFVINAFMLKLAAGVIPGFHVEGFWSAVLGSVLISLASLFLTSLVSEKGRIEVIRTKRDAGQQGRDMASQGRDLIDLEKNDDDQWR
ncbi:MAG: phage holin family protein [Desulfobacterales bacterium]|jgi:putative membrane protein